MKIFIISHIFLFDPVIDEDLKCFMEVKKDHLKTCQQASLVTLHNTPRYSKSIYELLSGNSTDHSCKDVLKTEQCLMRAATVNQCSLNVKKMFQILLSPPGIVICDDFPEIFELNNNIDIDNISPEDDNENNFDLVK
ncbi:uncharacterized protein LOC127280533 isoform X2 [Leptopilina boulardi]|uniref:uncharacterized protein LOC127280533 isoform X2 n=1 Tax=Leptopilina boulardi TaxID=63433 RepID=UPI0021F55ABC|nr:uncharacterized protein LOC127280533 isoform X2 [Leptopilina boulardi]